MNEKLIDAILAALTEQRDQALNAAAHLKAHATVLNAECEELRKRVTELEVALMECDDMKVELSTMRHENEQLRVRLAGAVFAPPQDPEHG